MSLDLVKDAYLRFKNNIYYDTTSQHVRKEICDFESNYTRFNKKLNLLAMALESEGYDEEYWDQLINKTSYNVAVKEFSDLNDVDKDVISSKFKNKSYKTNRVIRFAEIPIELQIAATLFVMLFGCKLESEIDTSPYGNKIDDDYNLKGKHLKQGLKLYKPYAAEYKRWRNNAINTIKLLDEQEKSSVLINLDIKEFYTSARVDFNVLERLLIDGKSLAIHHHVFDVIYNLHKKYASKIGSDNTRLGLPLPIGLMTSGLLANWYLNPLDKSIKEKINPEYYGRYVDDILIVVRIRNDSSIPSKEEYIHKVFSRRKILKEVDGGLNILVGGLENLKIQKRKLKIIHFMSHELTSMLDKYINEIRHDSSEYRLIEDEASLDEKFDDHAFKLEYTRTGGALSEVTGFSDDKFGVSYYLGKKINLALQGIVESESEADEKLLRLFNGPMAIELFSLWEKLLTYLLMSSNDVLFHRQIEQLVQSIICLKYKNNDKSYAKKLEKYYVKHLIMATGSAYSLKPSLITDLEKEKIKLVFSNYLEVDRYLKFVVAIRKSNMVRHRYIQYPLLNYLKDGKGLFIDLIHHSAYFSDIDSCHEICSHKLQHSPRFVNFDEVMSFELLRGVLSATEGKISGNGDILNSSLDTYFKINKSTFSGLNEEQVKEALFEVENEEMPTCEIRSLHLKSEETLSVLKVGLVNMDVPEDVFTQEYLRKPIVSSQRKASLNKILDSAQSLNADILLFPEISIPVSRLSWLIDWARKNQQGMIFGLEHWVVGNFAFNFLIELLPIHVDGYRSLVMNIRLKNHYSPNEEKVLKGFGYKIPENEKVRYDLVFWKNVAFTAFNCYELCNIEHRSHFKSKIDVLFASEFNQDTLYFSNIIESATRDLHCYIAQSNDSSHGDSRLVRPQRSYMMDIANIKGGVNPVILVGELDIKSLRNFQLLDYYAQKEADTFKPTPPDFDKSNVRKRIELSA